MNIIFVTSFGQSYYDNVAKHTLPWIVKATKHYQLEVFYEDTLTLNNAINDIHVNFHNLLKCSPELVTFLLSIKDDKLPQGLLYQESQDDLWTDEQKTKGYNYRLNAYVFCRKWFAIKCAYERAAKQHESFVLCWLDADILFHGFLSEFIRDVNNTFRSERQKIAYLSRDYIHSECGFLLFKSSQESLSLINDVCNMYSSHDVFKMNEWHDSYIFDIVRECMNKDLFVEMANGKIGEDVFNKCFMSDYATHMKGCNKRKLEEFINELKSGKS